MWYPERILPIKCPYCNNVFFAVKNFAKRLVEFVDNFSDQPTFHSCQFMWQNFQSQNPMALIFNLDEDFISLPENYYVFFRLKPLVIFNRGLIWKLQTPSAWMLMQDNAAFLNFTHGFSESVLRLGVLVGWNLNKDKTMPARPKFSQKILIKHSEPQTISIKAVDIVFEAKDTKKLMQYLYSLIQELKKFGQKPLFLLPKPLDHTSDEASVRVLTFHYNPQVDDFFQEHAVFPKWLDYKFLPKVVKFKSGFKF